MLTSSKVVSKSKYTRAYLELNKYFATDRSRLLDFNFSYFKMKLAIDLFLYTRLLRD